MGIWIVLLVIVFHQTHFSLLKLTLDSGLHSHILLVPFISVYLLYLQRDHLPVVQRGSPRWAALPLAAGVAAWLLATGSGLAAVGLPRLSPDAVLAMQVLSFLCFLVAGGFLFLGRRWMSSSLFPVAFLGWMIPLPERVLSWLENGSKIASAEVASLFFSLSATPNLRDGFFFRLPGIVIEVAQECSGIRSSLVLFITSCLAAYLFLRSPWRRALLVALVIPLGFLRNGFRIWTIGQLCVYVGPEMINSVIHKRGGPAFFALSLLPLFALIWWLRRGETRSK